MITRFFQEMFRDFQEKKETKLVLRNKKGKLYYYSNIPVQYQVVEAITQIDVKSITDINEKKSEFTAFLTKNLKYVIELVMVCK